MTDDPNRPMKGGGVPRSHKRTKGRRWLLQRNRKGKTWAERKARSHRYIPAKVR